MLQTLKQFSSEFFLAIHMASDYITKAGTGGVTARLDSSPQVLEHRDVQLFFKFLPCYQSEMNAPVDRAVVSAASERDCLGFPPRLGFFFVGRRKTKVAPFFFESLNCSVQKESQISIRC